MWLPKTFHCFQFGYAKQIQLELHEEKCILNTLKLPISKKMSFDCKENNYTLSFQLVGAHEDK